MEADEVAAPGFPVTFQTEQVGIPYGCRLCTAMFTTDQRGLAVLQHPQLGGIVVCYPCARDLSQV